jgi:serine kinase of HPr protein (carbohydrate metabolism regulator)
MNSLDNFKKPTFIIKNRDHSLLWFGTTNQFLIVQDALEVFFSESLVLTKPQYQEALEKLVGIHPEISGLMEAISIDNTNTFAENTLSEDYKHLPPNDFEVSNLGMGQHTLSVYYGSKALKTLFEAPFAHLKTNSDNFTKELFITKKESKLNLYAGKKLIYTTTNDQLFVLQAQFTNKLTEFYHNISSPNWLCAFHACAVQKDNKAFLLLGDSGVGKSTLTALLALSGYRLIADDLVLMDDDLKIYDNPAALSLKENSWAVVQQYCNGFDLPQTSAKTKGNIRMKYLPLHAIQNNTPSTFNVDAMVWVNYSKSSVDAISLMETKDMFECLIPDTWINPVKSSAMAFSEWAIQVKALKLTYSDFNSAKKLLDAQL